MLTHADNIDIDFFYGGYDMYIYDEMYIYSRYMGYSRGNQKSDSAILEIFAKIHALQPYLD